MDSGRRSVLNFKGMTFNILWSDSGEPLFSVNEISRLSLMSRDEAEEFWKLVEQEMKFGRVCNLKVRCNEIDDVLTDEKK